MHSVNSREQLAAARSSLVRYGTIALVPTMGALHAGHLKLVEEAKARADAVIVSIFVNPTQFAPGEDLDLYPRQEERDLEMLKSAGADLVWLPAVTDLYPDGPNATLKAGAIAECWEGAARPGHFDGVATVVARLFDTVAPDIAVFGEKDFQQLAVIRAMALDEGFAVKIVGVPTVRDEDGLALSSRNAYLTQSERVQAPTLYRALKAARDAIRGGARVDNSLACARAALAEAGFGTIDYLALVNADTLEPLNRPRGAMRMIAAARLGNTRLIDNLAV